jgi:hypothetical protein
VLTVLPILFGESSSYRMNDLFETRDTSGKTAIERLPAIVPGREVAVVQEFLRNNGVQPTPGLTTRTVRQTVEAMTEQFLAVRMWDLCGPGTLDVHGAGPTVQSAQMYETCTVEAAKAVQATLKLRGDEPEPEPEPEPVPPVPPEGVPPTALSGVEGWTEQQVAAWLRDVMQLGDVADAALAEGGVDGTFALMMDKDDWKEFGARGVKALKIVSQLKKLV